MKTLLLTSLLFVSVLWAEIEQITIALGGPYCLGCALQLERDLEHLNGYQDVRFDLATTSFILCKECLGQLTLEQFELMWDQYNLMAGEVTMIVHGIVSKTEQGHTLDSGSNQFELRGTTNMDDGDEVTVEGRVVGAFSSRVLDLQS